MKVIWLIDAEQWPRALLRAELLERGFDAVGYVTVRDAAEALPERYPDAIVVELRGQPLQQVERLRKLGVPVVLIAGATELSDLPSEGWAAILRRPISLGEIADHVAAVTAPPPPARPASRT